MSTPRDMATNTKTRWTSGPHASLHLDPFPFLPFVPDHAVPPLYPDGSGTCAVKLDRYRGIREIRVVNRSWAGKRLGEQDPDDVFLIPQTG